MSNVFTDDPWAAGGEDTGPADPWDTSYEPQDTAPAEVETASETKENKTVTAERTEDPIVLTFKQGTGYDAPWVVLRARTVDEAKTLVKSAVGEGLFDAVVWAAGEFAGKKPAAPARPAAAPAPQYQQQAPQAAPQQSQGGDGRTCNHGVMTYREGVSKAGKPYKGYFCNERDRNQQCRAIFVS